MNVRIIKSRAVGEVTAPPSKSMAHRLLIAAAMCDGVSRIERISSCEDVLATIDCLRALGVKIEYTDGCAVVEGCDLLHASAHRPLNCRESGSTLRFLLPIAMLSENRSILTGTKKLISRPEDVYEKICKERGLLFEKDDASITVRGRLTSGEYRIPGNVSSQFITGLLFALSALQEESRIVITTALESRSYVELTRAAMAEFGVGVVWENENTLYISGRDKYRARDISVEGDWSGAAFIEAFNCIGGEARVCGLNEDSLQGDRAYRDMFALISEGNPTINIEDTPDLGPILFTLASMHNGATFIGTKRLKIKESDRALVMQSELSKFGANIRVEDNSVTVFPAVLHKPQKTLYGHNDHRVVMSLAVIASVYGGDIEGCEAISKSYPEFFDDIKKLGIEFEYYDT